jgi:hypothetical protein
MLAIEDFAEPISMLFSLSFITAALSDSIPFPSGKAPLEDV